MVPIDRSELVWLARQVSEIAKIVATADATPSVEQGALWNIAEALDRYALPTPGIHNGDDDE